MSFEPREYLRHMLEEARFLTEHSSDLTLSSFLADDTRRRAFVRSLEILGEAAKNVPQDFRESHPQIEWKAMARMRDRLIHGYFGIDYAIVWDVVRNKIPSLQRSLEATLDDDRD